MSGKRIDVLVVFNEDARIWYHYIVDHIGKDKFELNIQPINDGELVELIKLVDKSVTSSVISDVIGRSCVQRLANASAAKTFIVVASPGLIRVLHENSDFNYQRLIGDPLRTQVRFCLLYANTFICNSKQISIKTCTGFELNLEVKLKSYD